MYAFIDHSKKNPTIKSQNILFTAHFDEDLIVVPSLQKKRFVFFTTFYLPQKCVYVDDSTNWYKNDGFEKISIRFLLRWYKKKTV